MFIRLSAAVAAFNKANGFDDPVIVQYLRYMKELQHGNLGYSYAENQTVNSLFATDWRTSPVRASSDRWPWRGRILPGIAAGGYAAEERSFSVRRKPRSGAPLCPTCDAALEPLAIMGVRLRVRHQSLRRARGHRDVFGIA